MDAARAVDRSAWDGGAAMKACNTAADYDSICAGKRAGDPALRSSHALPHHYLGKGANADGTRNAISRLPQTQGLTNRAAAQAHLEAHLSEIQKAEEKSSPPTEDLFREVYPSVELRDDGEGGAPILRGELPVGEWTEINSVFEGRFMERVAPGVFGAAFAARAPKVMFQHGRDPQLGDKIIAAPMTFGEEDGRAFYEGPLLPGVDPLLVAGLRAKQYGSSWRMSVDSEEFVKSPGRSDHNPEGLSERTITGMSIPETGPVTFPAYAGSSAGVRSVTDEFRPVGETIRDLVESRPRDLARMISDELKRHDGATATEEQPPEEQPPATRDEKEVEKMAVTDIDRFASVDDLTARLAEIETRQAEMDSQFAARELDTEAQAEWDDLREEKAAIKKRLAHLATRKADLEDAATVPGRTEDGFREKGVQVRRDRGVPENIYDLGSYRMNSRDPEHEVRLLRDGAMRSVEGARFPGAERGLASAEKIQGHIEKLLDTVDVPDPEMGRAGGEIARRILATGSPLYERAFDKYLRGRGMSPEEQRALSIGTGSAGGFAVVYKLDPTIVPTSNFSVNPWRALARVETIAGTNEWKAVTSGAITAAYAAEVTEASDNAPTLAQPDIIVEKAQAYVPFSIEVGQDWGSLQSEMASLLQDAKDDLEATKFAVGAGHGSTEPKGVITGATNTTGTTTTATFVIADIYKVFEALPPRFRPRAEFAANLFIIDKIRQFDTSGGSGVWIGPQGLQAQAAAHGAGTMDPGIRVPLLGRGVYESTAMASALTTTSKILIVGDFRYFVIVDRVGLDIEVLPLVVGTNHRPTGQRGLYAYWRNSSDVLSAAAFQVLVT